MRELFTTETLTIPAGQAVSGTAKEAQALRILNGRVWITVEGITHDYWLFPGETFAVTPGVLTVMEADVTSSEVELVIVRSESALVKLGKQLRRLMRRFAPGRNAGTAVPGFAVRQ